MKHTVALALLLAAALLGSCRSSRLQGEQPKMNTGAVEIIDYQGAALGSAIPDWVFGVDGSDEERVRKALDIKSDTKVFMAADKGTDLDLLKLRTDQVDAQARVASSIEQTVGQVVQEELDVRQADEQTKAEAVRRYSSAVTNMTLNGLTKEASYWTKTRRPKTGVEHPTFESDYDISYNYYVVYTINSALYNSQVEKAIGDVQDNDNQTQFLKEVLTDKLRNAIVLSEEA